VVRAPLIMHGKTSEVSHDGTGVFSGLPETVTVTRYHSLIVRDLPEVLETNAWVDEAGERVVMGLRHRDLPVWGVQFHPESVLTDTGKAMLKTFWTSAKPCTRPRSRGTTSRRKRTSSSRGPLRGPLRAGLTAGSIWRVPS
jgi:hypothetical protein